MAPAAKIPVAVLGATGTVGQRFVQLLANHPWFELTAVAGSERSAGKRFSDVARWVIQGDPPPQVGDMIVQAPEPTLPARMVFSALPPDVAKEVEPRFAEAGYAVCSNASAFRYDPGVPLLIPDLNADHTAMIPRQQRERGWKGFIVVSPNCTSTGLAIALKPLHVAFGLDKVMVTTMQAASGAGYPGVPSLDLLDNVVPYIGGEEEKMEIESRLLLGHMDGDRRVTADFVISPQCNRVPVLDGHTECVSIQFKDKPSVEEAIAAMQEFRGPPSVRSLPHMPARPIVVRTEPDRPQPRRDRDAQNGMVVTVGRVRPCPILDLRMVVLVHNTQRGAAGGALLNGELLVAQGLVK